jgi:putative copper export protein
MPGGEAGAANGDVVSAIELTPIWLATARYLIYLSTLVVIGALGARVVVQGTRCLAPDPAGTIVATRVAKTGFMAALALTFSALFLLAGMAFAWFGPDALSQLDRAQAMVFGTAWGVSWQRVVTSAAVAAAAGAIAWRWRVIRGPVALGAAIMISLTVPLLGHGGTHGTRVWIFHATHLLGSGLWLGTLAVLARATWPVWRADAPVLSTLRGLLGAFSPLAVTGAALAIVSGLLLAYQHVDPLDALFTTDYGRTLMFKTGAVLLVAGLGFRNYRRHRGPLTSPSDRRWLRRLAVLEAILALVLILALTAWLTGLPVPHELED